MNLDEEYPKYTLEHSARLRALLQLDAELGDEERSDMTMFVHGLANRARELHEIFDRLVHEAHTPGEIGELLIAFQLTNEQMRGASDMIEKKLFDVGDRLKALGKSNRSRSARNGSRKKQAK